MAGTTKEETQALSQEAQGLVNRYYHGFRKLRLFRITKDGDDSAAPTYAEPVVMAGCVNVNITDGSSSQAVYAGDSKYDTIDAEPSLSGSMEFYNDVADDVKQWLLGYTKDKSGAIGYKKGGRRESFAAAYEVQGDKEPVGFVFYKIKVSKLPDFNPETDQDTVSPKTMSVDIECTPMNFKGEEWLFNTCRKSVSEQAFAKFYDAPLDPTAQAAA